MAFTHTDSSPALSCMHVCVSSSLFLSCFFSCLSLSPCCPCSSPASPSLSLLSLFISCFSLSLLVVPVHLLLLPVHLLLLPVSLSLSLSLSLSPSYSFLTLMSLSLCLLVSLPLCSLCLLVSLPLCSLCLLVSLPLSLSLLPVSTPCFLCLVRLRSSHVHAPQPCLTPLAFVRFWRGVVPVRILCCARCEKIARTMCATPALICGGGWWAFVRLHVRFNTASCCTAVVVGRLADDDTVDPHADTHTLHSVLTCIAHTHLHSALRTLHFVYRWLFRCGFACSRGHPAPCILCIVGYRVSRLACDRLCLHVCLHVCLHPYVRCTPRSCVCCCCNGETWGCAVARTVCIGCWVRRWAVLIRPVRRDAFGWRCSGRVC